MLRSMEMASDRLSYNRWTWKDAGWLLVVIIVVTNLVRMGLDGDEHSLINFLLSGYLAIFAPAIIIRKAIWIYVERPRLLRDIVAMREMLDKMRDADAQRKADGIPPGVEDEDDPDPYGNYAPG